MKYEKILLFSSIALPAVVLMRFLQLFFTVDVKTGFFKSEYEDAGRCLLVLIALGCAAVAVLCLTSHRNPENPPKKNLVTAVFSFITAAVTAIEIFSESFAGISLISDFTLPPISAVIPVFYFIIKVICVFTSVSSLALITDNILILAAYCTLLFFFLCFGKLYNGIDREYNFRKLQASGFASVLLCLTQSVPHIIFNISNGGAYRHTSNISNISLLAYGLFTAAFTLAHFSLKNTSAGEQK